MLFKDPETHQILGPVPLITWGKSYAYVSTGKGHWWAPAKNIKPYLQPLQHHQKAQQEEPQEEPTERIP